MALLPWDLRNIVAALLFYENESKIASLREDYRRQLAARTFPQKPDLAIAYHKLAHAEAHRDKHAVRIEKYILEARH